MTYLLFAAVVAMLLLMVMLSRNTKEVGALALVTVVVVLVYSEQLTRQGMKEASRQCQISECPYEAVEKDTTIMKRR